MDKTSKDLSFGTKYLFLIITAKNSICGKSDNSITFTGHSNYNYPT
jgi:hypothetical protein